MNIIKWVALAYFVVFVPSLIFGIKIGASITFGVIVLWVLYEAIKEHYNKREEYLKNLLRNSEWDEKTINYELEKINKEYNNH